MNIAEIFLWIGIPALLYGYLYEYKKHYFRIVGFVLLGIFWAGEAPYFLTISDYVNAAMIFTALPLFSYFAYNEYLSKKWEEDPDYMKFLAGGISIGMLVYFGIHRIPFISGILIKVVAGQTATLSNFFGYNFTASSINFVGNPLWYRVNNENIYVSITGSNINIILACTGLQTLAAAGALLYCTKADKNKKIKSMLLTLPTIYIANIFRNAIVIYLTMEGITSFEMAHNEIAKTGSVILLMILLFAVFEIMPEFHDNIMKVISLPKREPLDAVDQN